jgi:hypothetical protein
MADGRLNKCKECTKRDVLTHRNKNIEYFREYDRARGARMSISAKLRVREERPYAYRARYAVTNAVRDGRLKKPDSCERCGTYGRIHGHHEDYAKPLEVVWLCAACHKARHRELGWGYVWNIGMDAAG